MESQHDCEQVIRYLSFLECAFENPDDLIGLNTLGGPDSTQFDKRECKICMIYMICKICMYRPRSRYTAKHLLSPPLLTPEKYGIYNTPLPLPMPILVSLYDSLPPEWAPLELCFFFSYFLIQGCFSTSESANRSSGSLRNNFHPSALRPSGNATNGRLTLVMRSAASGETESGILRSTLRIRRYVANTN